MKTTREEATKEYLRGGVSYRELGKRYGVSQTTIAKWIKSVILKEKEALGDPQNAMPIQQTPLYILELQKELREAELRNKLLEAMLDIGKEEYGIDLRKKPGTKRS